MAQKFLKTDRCSAGYTGLAANDAINDNFEELYAGGAGGGGITEDSVDTLTNKTMSGDDNTFSDIPASAILVSDTEELDVSIFVKRVVSSNVDIVHTGTTSETTIFTGAIPGNSIGVNGHFEIHTLWTLTNNANAKTLRIKFNGTNLVSRNLASNDTDRWYSVIFNRNSLSSQIGPGATAGQAVVPGVTSIAQTEYSFNTAVDITVTVTVTLANGADTVTLRAFQIIAYP